MTTYIISSIDDIKHAYYINLERRTDRKTHVENELNKIGIKAERFNAIQLPNGALGCSMSHLKCIENAKQNNWDHVLIVEDDITFLNPEVFINSLNNFLSSATEFDVLLLAGNNMSSYTKINDYGVKIKKCQTSI